MDVLISQYEHNGISELLLRVNGFAIYFSHYVHLLKNTEYNCCVSLLLSSSRLNQILYLQVHCSVIWVHFYIVAHSGQINY